MLIVLAVLMCAMPTLFPQIVMFLPNLAFGT